MKLTKKQLQAWYDSLPVVPYAEIKREEAAARMRDYERIARREATPEQIQRENSIFTPEQVRTFQMVNLEEALLKLR